MAEYIELESLLNEIRENKLMLREPAAKRIIGIIESGTAADVRPERHGEWIVDDVESSDGTYAAYIEAHCSQCNFALGFENGEYGWYIGDRIPFDYCPNCGAKMDVKDD